MDKYIYVGAGFEGVSQKKKTPQVVYYVNGYKMYAQEIADRRSDKAPSFSLSMLAEDAKKLGLVDNLTFRAQK